MQQVKRWRLLPVEWTAETEELTPSLKLKRRVIHAKYAEIIEEMYAPVLIFGPRRASTDPVANL